MSKKNENNNTNSAVQLLEKPDKLASSELKENNKEILKEKQESTAIQNKNQQIQTKKKKSKPNNSAPVIVKAEEKSVTIVKDKEKAITTVSKKENVKIKEKNTNVTENKNKTEKKEPVVKAESTVTPPNSTKKGFHTITIFGILVGILIALILVAFLIFSFVMHNSNNIFSGIYIKNIDVSNLSQEETKNKLEQYIQTSLPEDIILTHGEYEVALNVSELNVKFDIDSAVKTAYELGRNGNIITDGYDILSFMINNQNVEPTLSFDDEALTNSLNDISSKLPDKVIESGYYIDGNSLILNKGSDGNVINVEKTKQKIIDAIKNLKLINNSIEISVTPSSPTELNIDNIYNEVHKDAINASFTKEPLAVTPSKNGIDFSVSLDEAKAKLAESEKECVIPLKVVYPSVTTNMIGTEAFPDRLSTFSTNYAASNVNRTTNLRLAANKINGTVLMPGETFSYNQVVGERTIAAGYKEAPIYVSGRVEDGLGGGICQITTTLYNAAVFANLEIVERTNHQFVPSYVGAGRDATVVYGAIDFKFKNNRNYPIKIICSVSGGVANFQILGLKTSEDYDVEVYSRITSQSAGYTNSETYKVLKQNGSVVRQELLSKDTYKRH